MDPPKGQLLQPFIQQVEQTLQAALQLENKYRTQPVGDTEGNGNEQYYMPIVGQSVEEFENEVKTQLIELVQHYVDCVDDSVKSCAVNFAYAKNEFALLFEVWTKIRKIFDVIKYASIWETSTSNEGQKSLEELQTRVNETLLQHLFKAHLPCFNEAIRKLTYDIQQYYAVHQQMEQQQFQQQLQTFSVPDLEADPQSKELFHHIDYLLDFFRDTIDRVKNGTLSVWRREQKKAMFGIGLTADMARDLSVTKPAIALKNATSEFQDLANIWMQIDQLLCIFYNGKFQQFAPILQKSEACANHLLQSSLVVDWRYQGLCQPHIVVRAQTIENITIIVKILAANVGFQSANGQYMSLIDPLNSFITATFAKPTSNAVALSEEIAVQLRDNTVEDRPKHINRAGDITHSSKAAAGVLQSKLESDLTDNTLYAYFDSVAFVLPGVKSADSRRKKGPQQRSACTKYHIDVTATVVLKHIGAQISSQIQLQTISSPFSYSVANEQDKKLYRSFLWNLLGAHPDSVSCHCQPLGKDSEDLSLVYWGDYKEALRWLFYKLTYSRTLYDDELQHLGSRLLNTNYLPASKTFGSQRGDTSCPSFSKIRIEKKENKKTKYAPFFYWYFEAIELIMEKNETTGKTKEKRPTKETKEERKMTMASLFESGMILGFISRTSSEALLRASGENAMIIRFSDHFAGHMTVSYIKHIDNRREKLEHVRPLARNFLKGMSLPLVIAMLINLDNVHYIIASRLPAGQQKLGRESLKDKDDLVQNHLSNFEGGIYSDDHYAYARVMLHASQRDSSQAADMPSSSRSERTQLKSPSTPLVDMPGNPLDTLIAQHRTNPRLIQLLQELAAGGGSGTATPSTVPPSSWYNPSIGSPYSSSNMSPMSNNSTAQMVPSPSNFNPTFNQAQPPASAPSPVTFIQQNPFLPSQFPQMPMHSTSQMQQSYQPTPQMMQFQPTNAVQMVPSPQQQMVPSPQQQPIMMQSGQPTQWQGNPQAQLNNVNAMQGYHHQQQQQQQIQMGLQHMNIGPQQQHPSFPSSINQYPQQQGMMQQSPMPQMGHQQVAGLHASQNQNVQSQMVPQQTMMASYVQQPQQGTMQTSFMQQPQQQYQFQQFQQQQPPFYPQQYNTNMPAQQSQQASQFQYKNHAAGTDDESGQECRTSFEEDEDVTLDYESYDFSAAKVRRENNH